MISRRSFLTQLGVLGAGVAGVWWLRDNVLWPAPRPRFADASGSSGWLPFGDRAPLLVIIDAAVNGRPVRALLDSGAQTSVIDLALAAELGLALSAVTPVVAFGVSGAPQVGRTAAATLQVGALTLENMRVAVLDIAPIATASRRPFSIILGQDLLHTVVADVDFPGRRVAFYEPDDRALPPGGFYAPARAAGRELRVPVSLEGVSIDLVLDTGASGAVALSSRAAATAGLLDGRDSFIAPSITFGGLSQDQVVRVSSLNFAGVEYRDVRVHIYNPAHGARIPDGLLGVEVLDRFRVLIDTGRGRLYLIPGPDRRGRTISRSRR